MNHVTQPPGAPGAGSGPYRPDPSDGPFYTRPQAEAVFAGFAAAAVGGQFGHIDQFLADSLTDAIDSFPGAEVGAYDRLLIARVAGLFDPVDVAVIMSWIRRAAGDRPDESVNIVNPDLGDDR